MSLEGDIALLKRIPLFADLPDEQLRLVAFSSTKVDLQSGEKLFESGDPAASGYIVCTGAIELAADGDDAASATVCEPGSLVGELALFIDTQRPARARARGETQLMEIERKLIIRMLHEYPHLALRLRAKLSERLTATVSELAKVRKSLLEVKSSR